jgi:hypothetical protein
MPAGVHAQLVRRLVILCATSSAPSVEALWYSPQLITYADTGRRVATVTIGPRSGSYLVELPRVGPGNKPRADRIEVVPAFSPERVASLVTRNT